MHTKEIPPLKIVGTLVHLKIMTEERTDQLFSHFTSFSDQKLSFSGYLLHHQILSLQDLQKINEILRRGYYHCLPCQRIYPNPEGQQSQPRVCPTCKKPLAFYQHQSLDTPSTQGKIDTALTPNQEYSPTAPGPSTQIFERRDSPKYPVLQILGQGGFGQVYEVQESLTGRKMALKILKSGASQRENTRQRFLREIQITANLEHPNIMPVYECGYLKDGSLYFVMKELRGGTLKELMEKRENHSDDQPSLREILEILLKGCDALEYAHSRGIVHRDLKPSNIAVGTFGEVMVLDWGIAKAVGVDEPEDQETSNTRRTIEIDGQTLTLGGMLGTPGYMAPEQARGEEATPRSDIHALGALLYEVLAQRRSLQGPLSKILVDLLMNPSLPPEAVSPHLDIPRELSAIAMKCLEKDLNQRYRSIREFRRDLVRYMEGFSVSAIKDSPLEALKKWVHRNRALSDGIVLAVMTGLISIFAMGILESQKKRSLAEGHLQKAEKILKSPLLVSAEVLKKKYPRDYLWGRQETLEGRKERQRILKIYMNAKKEFEEALEWNPTRGDLKKKLFAVEKEIGHLALLGGNYLLAETSFEKCKKLNFQESIKLLLLVNQKKEETQKAQKKRVEAIMNILATPPKAGMSDEYVTEIVKMGRPEVVKDLLAFIASPHTWQRKVAIEALGKMGDRHTFYNGKDVVEWLVERLELLSVKENPEECETLVWALGRLRDERANKAVIRKRWTFGQLSAFWSRTQIPYSWLPETREKGKKTAEQFLVIGMMKEIKGKYRESIEDFNQAIQINPQYTNAYSCRGSVYTILKQYKKALEDYNQAIQINPQLASAYNNRGMVYKFLKQYQKALEDYNQAIQINPQLAKIYNNRGNLYSDLKQYQKAIDDLSQAIKIDPQYERAYGNRGYVYLRLEEYPKTIDDLSQAIKINPKYSRAYYDRGLIYISLKQYQKAIDDLSQVIQINPKYSLVYFNRARAYHFLNRYQQAVADFKVFLRLNPNHPYAEKIRDYIRKKR